MSDDCRRLIKRDCERLGLDVVIQDLCSSLKEKRLIVFDMDMTIVDFEIINRLASFGGVDEQVKAITEMAMNGEMDFKESLRQRVRLLKGMPLATLQEIAADLRLTPDLRSCFTTSSMWVTRSPSSAAALPTLQMC